MSAFYLLGLLAAWAVLTGLLWKLWRKLRAEAGARRVKADLVFAVAALAWLAVSFWYGGGRKCYYDAKVERLCAIDGGIKVYETVRLPAEKFNEWGQVNFYKPTQGERALGPEYVFHEDVSVQLAGIPEIRRYHYKVTNAANLAVLAETISYQRGGGDLPGPWQPSAFTCPPIAEAGPNALLMKMFLKEQ